MNSTPNIRQKMEKAIIKAFSLSPSDIPDFVLEQPRNKDHGDMSCNVALMLAKILQRSPRDISEDLVQILAQDSIITKVESAGPGFINLSFHHSFWQSVPALILKADANWGESKIGQGNIGQENKVNVEYVSANPTGPMHIGHARGAVVGDVIATLLEKTGHHVVREYYINDAGGQVDALARSVWIRYQQCCGEEIKDPISDFYPDFYPGEYLIPVAQHIFERDGRMWLDKGIDDSLPTLRDQAIEAMIRLIREDLEALGVRHDVFFSEKKMIQEGHVEVAIATLEKKKLTYRGILGDPKSDKGDASTTPLLLFRSSRFGDDQDRPLRKADNSVTYFASDAAYHHNKYRRGFKQMINVWGRDHGGYIKRVQAALGALSDNKAKLDVQLVALVQLSEGGEKVKMSKRSGTLVTLRQALDQLHGGVIRFTMLTRRSDVPLDFDLAKARDESRNNPYFYVQYAHARCCSVLRAAPPAIHGQSTDFSILVQAGEIALMKSLALWPQCVEDAALTREPHRIVYYLGELASCFHALWSAGNRQAQLRFLQEDQPELTQARLALIKAVRITLARGLEIIGVEPLQELKSP